MKPSFRETSRSTVLARFTFKKPFVISEIMHIHECSTLNAHIFACLTTVKNVKFIYVLTTSYGKHIKAQGEQSEMKKRLSNDNLEVSAFSGFCCFKR